MKTRSSKKAFTIVELLIVIAIIGILSAILFPAFNKMIDNANAKSALADAKNISTQFVSESRDIRC
jgi:prepilin-type N-terminal cleavage/methylation domain-containing protein